METHRLERWIPVVRWALAWRRMDGVEPHENADELHDEAERLGLSPADLPPGTTAQQAEQRTWELYEAWRLSSALGHSRPVVKAGDLAELRERFNSLEGKLRSILDFVSTPDTGIEGESSHYQRVEEREINRRIEADVEIKPVAIPPSETSERWKDLVTLDQMAGMVHRSKRCLERYKTKGKLPAPDVEGGGGKPDLFHWPTVRPWLESTFGITLPARHPANVAKRTDI